MQRTNLRDKLPAIEALCAAREHGNFTRAARALGVTPQAVSRAIARLEAHVGVKLFRRNTRRVEPTPEGEHYYGVCADLLAKLEHTERALAPLDGQPRGTVRMSVPTTYGNAVLLPGLAVMHKRYPGIDFDIDIDNGNADFVRDGFDLAIRMGKLSDAPFVARSLGDFPLGLFASPDYLADAPPLREPADLARHRCAAFVMPRSGQSLPWLLSGEDPWVPARGLQIGGDPQGLVNWACGGGGVIQTYHFMADAAVDRGMLVECLPDTAGASRPFSLLYTKDATASPAVRAVIDQLVPQPR